MKKSRPFLDYDDCSLEFVLEDVFKLQEKYDLTEADVLESSPTYLYDCTFWNCGIVKFGSFHVRFYDVRSWEEVKEILDSSNCHEGFKHFSKTIGDITLRISNQEGSKKPEKVCTVKEEEITCQL